MTDRRKEQYPSTFTIDNFSSTTQLASNEVIKVPISSKESLNEKPYDPYEHRVIEHPNTFSGALIHILKSSLGTGILAIPMAFAQVGLLVGFVGTVLIGILCTYTVHILVVASQQVCAMAKVPSLGFAETAGACFEYGPKALRGWAGFARLFVDFALICTYYMGAAVYMVFISESVRQLIDVWYPNNEFTTIYYLLIILGLLLFFCQIRELKYLVPFSFVANITMCIAFGITLYYMFKGVKDVNVDERSIAKPISGLPSFFSTVIFAMEGIGTVFPIENSMRQNKFIGCPGVLNIAMSFIVSLYAVMGFFGYYTFGDETQASITLNLPLKDRIAQVAKACISVSVFLTFLLQFYVPMDITWRKVKDRVDPKFQNIAQILLRIVILFFIFGIAASVPDLGDIIDLVGAIFFSTLGLFIPAVVDTVLNWDRGLGRFKWRLYKNILIGSLSLFALFSGSFYAIKHIVEKRETS